jgi:hypothetical protein
VHLRGQCDDDRRRAGQDEQHGPRGPRLRLIAVALAVLLVLAGPAAIVVALTSQVHAPQPPASAAAPPAPASAPAPPVDAIPPAPGSPATQPQPAAGAVPPLPAAQPTHLTVPAIGVSSDLLQLGLNADNTLQVPPLSKDSTAGWYRGSRSPGQLGPAVLLGHVDSAEYGAGVFFKLGALRPGDLATVTRADHTTATFKVDRVASYPKNQFPPLEVCGSTNDPELRLITCGGAFDSAARSYLNNIVVYASLVSSSTT